MEDTGSTDTGYTDKSAGDVESSTGSPDWVRAAASASNNDHQWHGAGGRERFTGIADDGLTDVSYNYQWLAEDTGMRRCYRLDLHPGRLRRGQDRKVRGADEGNVRPAPAHRYDGGGRPYSAGICDRTQVRDTSSAC